MKNDTKKLIRLQFDFSPASVEQLEKLGDKTNVRTRAEVLRNALALYHLLIVKAEEDQPLNISSAELKAMLRLG